METAPLKFFSFERTGRVRQNAFSVDALRLSFAFAALLALAVANISAWEIQFSTAGGYPAGTSPLSGSPIGNPVWLASGFTVNGTDKTASTENESEAVTAPLTTPIPLAAGQMAKI